MAPASAAALPARRPSRCPVCAPAVPPGEEVVAHGTQRVVRCSGCGLVRLAEFPAPEAVRENVSGNYGYHGEIDFTRPWTLAEATRTVAFANEEASHARLERLLSRAGLDLASRLRVHDVGCSCGFSLYLGRRRGWEMTGNDLSELRRDFGQRVLGVDVFVGYFSDYPAPAASLDAVLLRHVLEHLPDPLGELTLVRERLSEGGVLVVEVPNFAAPTLKLQLLRQRLGMRRRGLEFIGVYEPVAEHLWQFTSRTLAALLGKAGFEVRAVETASAHSNHSAAVRALLRHSMHRARLGNYLVVAARRARRPAGAPDPQGS